MTTHLDRRAGPAEVVRGLRATFDSGRTRDRAWREGQLSALARLLDEQQDALAAAITADMRRPAFEALLLDVAPTVAEVRHARRHLRGWMRPHRVPTGPAVRPARAWYRWDPKGVVLVVAPWNYPVQLALAPVAAALAAGCCVVLKPSELTPTCSAVLADLLPRYLDPEAVAVVEGGAEATTGLLDQGLDHCFFTGSPEVGATVMAAAAPHLTSVTLELGGRCPAVVTASADLEVAARRIAFGKLANSGQTCVAPDHVLVDAAVRDELVDRLTGTLTRFARDRPVPVLSPRHAARQADLLAGAGGTVALGGQVDVEDAQVRPTVVVDPDPGCALLAEEVFGPVLPVVTVASLDEAVRRIGAGGHPLATYLFTEDRQDERRVLAAVTTGAVVVNHVILHLTVPDLPFGGVRTSGTGTYHGRWGFEAFSHPTAVLRASSRPDLPLVYPPYGRLKRGLLRRLL